MSLEASPNMSSSSVQTSLPTQNTTQQTCKLLTLPPEIRAEIYSHVIGGGYIRIGYDFDIEKYREAQRAGIEPPVLWRFFAKRCQGDKSSSDEDYNAPLTSIWRTCRQMYADTALMPYSSNTFGFMDNWVMEKWMDSLTPDQKASLRRLDLFSWYLTEERARELPSLQTVRVRGEWHDASKTIQQVLQDSICRDEHSDCESVCEEPDNICREPVD